MKNNKIKASFKTRSFKIGGYSILAAVIVIAIAVIVNLVVAKLPTKTTNIDMTAENILDLSQQTDDVVGGLNSEVKIYWLVQSGNEDRYIEQLLNRYSDLSKNLTWEKVDYVVHPSFATAYTSEDVADNSVIVVCGDRSRYVSNDEIYIKQYDIDYSTYQYYVKSEQFDGENAFTSAISYVTSEALPKVYTLTGHGESELTDTIKTAIGHQNMDVESLSLLTSGSVPDDCDCLLIAAPQSDLSADESKAIQDYLAAGGSLYLMTDYNGPTLTNLMALMENYGVSGVTGVVMEGDMNKCVKNYPYFVLPTIGSHDITKPLTGGSYYVLMPAAHGIKVLDDHSDTLTISPLLTTSDSSYSKQDLQATTTDKADGDIDGPFDLGVAISDSASGASIVWLSNYNMLNDDIDSMVSGTNQDLFINGLGWMCKSESTISIHAKNLTTDSLTVPTATASRLSIIMVGAIPLCIIGLGVFTVVRRRRQ